VSKHATVDLPAPDPSASLPLLVKYRFHTCDVFTDTRFGGNPLAVLTHAEGLSDDQMQRVAREFNFSETTFVFPPEAGHTRSVRVFTPATEVPFAGHPNVGTAFVLAATGELGAISSSLTVSFEEKAGLVPVTIHSTDGGFACELAAPQPLVLGETIDVPLVASAISLAAGDIVTRTHRPQMASVGLPFLVTELRDRAALGRARIDLAGFDRLAAEGIRPSVHLYTRATGGFDLRARMFAPLSGVPEDPATGSAGCALAGLLAHHDAQPGGSFSWRIAQGVEMGRPSTLVARAEKTSGVVRDTWVGGTCVMVSEGYIQLD
jgi:trans-2,3-dihydro-3-hydroxyanthranilate isomerase